ncbi:aerolysin family beta-barrel pore-forming toxin [Vibrio sp. OCN044]|uniref:Aerolysin family beta-barrel pore-forming toxin n=1 Tax=Vibrio tetraodonis subsp. pristinus TaxID=2695891 RepID=A0A6L8LXP2_9VIBR|nr:aerolysin family beta-barrel pore-forming toxin [Vibrio tetraodonis]MYM57959.1 aerolysin family beta-barrel pore-forming toxin [Vibrio tetraodonis subsp. pristinus]
MIGYSLRVFLCVIGLSFFTHHSALANTPSRYIELEDIKLQRKPCQSGYEPISLSTAMMYQQRLAAKMGEWQLTNIEDGLIIMGPGHKGNIKIANRLAYTSWCIESDKKNTYQADVSLPLTLKAPNRQKLEWLMVNSKEFYEPLAELANLLGYAWSGGVDGRQSGEDMVTSVYDRGVYQIKSDAIGFGMPCNGYRCDDRLVIDITNLSYQLLPSTVAQRDSTDEAQEILGVRRATVTNESDINQQYRVTFSYKKQTSWKFKSSINFEQAVSVKSDFTLPFIGESEVEVSFSAGQSWGEENSGAASELVTDTIVVNVPPKRRQEVLMTIYKTSKVYPYKGQARVSYDLGLYGFLSYSGNADIEHPINRPHKYYQWEIGRKTSGGNNLGDQFENRNLPLQDHTWDWPWVVNSFGLPYAQAVIDAIERPIVTEVGGDLSLQSVYGADVYYGETEDLESSNRVRRSLDNASEWKVINTFDALPYVNVEVERL